VRRRGHDDESLIEYSLMMNTLPLQLGYSFCPNDTFIFYALTHGKLPDFPAVAEVLEDVETLNHWAVAGRLPLTKISYAAYARVRQDYIALRAGGALGRGVGPLLVAKTKLHPSQCRSIASPGSLTTAQLLLTLALPEPLPTIIPMRYDAIMPAVLRGEVDAGLIIHESRFTYLQHGLVSILDLGSWWEHDTGLPLPLGAILARRDLGKDTLQRLNAAVRNSLVYAYAHPDEPKTYIKQHALEQDDAVIQAHIDLYVNEYSLDISEVGERAVQTLFARAEARGVLQSLDVPLFVEPIPEETL
jgi:1,4-dihydroxy-6-naphthoate synthase